MKNKISKIMAIFIIFLILIMNMNIYVYGVHSSIPEGNRVVFKNWEMTKEVTKEDVVKELKNFYGYDKDTFYETMKLNTQIEIVKKVYDIFDWFKIKYTIRIGKAENKDDKNKLATISGLTMDQIKTIYGYTGTEKDWKNNPWNAIIIVSGESGASPINGNEGNALSLKIAEIYTGDDYTDGENLSIDNGEAIKTADENWDNNMEKIKDVVKNVSDWVKNFIKNPVGTLVTTLLDLLKAVLADAPQTLINLIQVVPLETESNWTLYYKYDDLTKEKELNEYSNATDYGGNGSKSYDSQKVISITSDEDIKEEFTSDKKIPVIPVDVYTMSTGDVGLFDVNFLTGNKNNNHKKGSPWLVLRTIAATIIHMTMYISAGILIVTLVWHGLQIVRHSIDNPMERAEHKKGLERFAVSLAMLVGTVVIMGIGIFASEAVLNTTKISTSSEEVSTHELPIRVNVKDAYSFSTNITGYVAYMASIKDVDRYIEKACYVLTYILLVLLNVVMAGIMFVRVLIMWILSIIGPIIAAFHSLNKEEILPIDFKTWGNLYLVVASVQLIFAIFYRIVLETAIS